MANGKVSPEFGVLKADDQAQFRLRQLRWQGHALRARTSGGGRSGWTCTVADGSQWVFANIFPTFQSHTRHRMFIELMPAG